jgi:MFS family permease
MGTRTARSRPARRAPAPRAQAPEPKPEERSTRKRGGLPPALAAVLVFAASGAVLVLEILSVRLLAPYVGLTLETTTAIIGAVLAGIAAGAAAGGWLADRVNPRWLLVYLFVLGGLLVFATVPIVRALGPSGSSGGDAAALGVTFAALVPVAAVLSGVTPTVARLQLRDLRASGTIVGRLSGWATAGALVGTFATGFVLVPLFPVSATVLGIGIALVLGGVLLGLYMRLLSFAKTTLAAIAALALAGLALSQHSPCLVESAYHCIQLETDFVHPAAEYLLLDGDYNSAIDPSEPRYLGFRYERWIAEAIDAMAPAGKPLRAVFVGGGAFTLPRWLAATRPGSTSNTLEVDPKLVDFDREQLGLRTTPSLRATIGDARLTMRREAPHSADLIVGDAFSSRTVPWQLMTREWLVEVKRALKPDGLYVLNLIDLRPLRLLRAEAATVLAAFANVRLVTTPGSGGRPKGDNEVLLASNGPLPPASDQPADGATNYDRPELARIVAGAQSLSDDYAPVDQLMTR